MTTSITPNVSEFLKRIDPFDKLPSYVVDQLAATVLVKYLEKDEVIEFSALCTQRFLYLIRTGVVEQRSPNGALKARLGEEDQFGFTFLEPLIDSEDGYQAHAVEDSLLYMIPHQQLQLVTQTNPEFSDFFTSKSKDRLHKATRAVVSKEDKPFFFKTVGEVASENITIVMSTTSIKEVAKKMCGKRPSSCAVVVDDNDIVGMVTDRDMTRAVIAAEVDTNQPITAVMNRSPVVVQHEDKIIQAISLMLQYHIRCLPVVKDQQVVGLLTTTHLVHNHKTQSLFLIEKIRYADSIEALVALKQEKQYIFQALVESGVSAEVQGQVMSMIMDAFTRRIIQISEEKLGPPPCEYAWLVAGSHARNEVHMLSDQDSAIVLADDAKESDRAYFLHLAMIVCNGLDACGYPLCTGKYMAATPKWCQPISRWKQYYHKWVSNPEYNRLLSISVFLEIRAIHGNKEFVTTLHNTLHTEIHENQRFLSSLVRDAITTNPPLGIFNSLVLEKGGDHTNTLNIKKFALNLIIDLARIFCLAAGGSLTGTEERFRYAVEKGTLSQDSCDNIIEAYRFISQVRFRHQLMAAKEGRVPDNQISPDDFSSFERKHLKEAFKIIAQLQDVAKLKFLNVG
jgi:CBS domain-containing protein